MIAKDGGFSISADDLTKAQSEISEGKMEGASGGNTGYIFVCVANPVASALVTIRVC